jgi:hypothetical protein
MCLGAHHRFADKILRTEDLAANRSVTEGARVAQAHCLASSNWNIGMAQDLLPTVRNKEQPPVINRKHNRAARVIDDWRVGHSGAYVALQLGDGEPVLLALAEARKLGGALVVEASNHRESVGLIARQEESKTDGSSRARARGAQGPEEYVASKMHAAGRRAPS